MSHSAGFHRLDLLLQPILLRLIPIKQFSNARVFPFPFVGWGAALIAQPLFLLLRILGADALVGRYTAPRASNCFHPFRVLHCEELYE
jgi:hypothetical protein